MIIELITIYKRSLKNGLSYKLVLKKAYWSRGAGLAKQRSIRFALTFLLLFASRQKVNKTMHYICNMNYFELFELPISIQIDKAKLAQKYFELQKKYHPDFFANGTEHEQEQALEISSQLNKALKTFKNEDQTIKYVLQLKALLEEEEKYQLPPAFLMEMMELNEELSQNSAGQIQELENQLYTDVQPIIENYDDATITTPNLLKLKEYYYKKKYLQRILDRLEG
jgi:molecular chaperone HscB